MATNTAVTPRPLHAVTVPEETAFGQALWAPPFAQGLAQFFASPQEAQVFLMAIWNQTRTNPALLSCTSESVQYQVIRLAQWRINPALPNQVALIPRTEKGQTVLHADLGYAGLRELALRGGEITDIFCKDVCDNDTFEPPATIIDKPHHRLPTKMQPRGRVIGYYCTLLLHNGHWRYEQMTVPEVEAHYTQFCTRNNSPAWQGGKRPKLEVGFCSFDAMALKTVLRKGLSSRNLRLSTDLQGYLAEAEQLDEAERRPTPAMLQGYSRTGEREARLSATEQAKSLDEHVEDLAPTSPTTASHTGRPLPPKSETAGSALALDEAEFSYRLETIWRGAGLMEPQMEDMRARLARRCGSPIPAKWYDALLVEAHQWAVKRQENAKNAQTSPEASPELSPPTDANLPVVETQNGEVPEDAKPSLADLDSPDACWRTIEAARGAPWLSPGLQDAIEALYTGEDEEPTPAHLLRLATMLRADQAETTSKEQMEFYGA